MLGFKSFYCIFLCLVSVSGQEGFTADQERAIIEYLQKDGTCEYSFLESKIQYLPRCMLVTLLRFRETVRSELTPSTYTKAMCPVDLAECLVEVGNDLKHCLHEDKYKIAFENPAKTVSSIQEYACSDDGKPLEDFLTNGMPCLYEAVYHYRVEACRVMIVNQIHTLSPETLSDFKMDDICSIVTGFGICIIDATEECKDKTAQNFIRTVFTKILEINCKDDFDRISSSNNVSGLKIFSSCLVVIVISYLMIFYI